MTPLNELLLILIAILLCILLARDVIYSYFLEPLLRKRRIEDEKADGDGEPHEPEGLSDDPEIQAEQLARLQQAVDRSYNLIRQDSTATTTKSASRPESPSRVASQAETDPQAALQAELKEKMPYVAYPNRSGGLLSRAEYRFMMKSLKPYAKQHELIIAPKPALREFIQVDPRLDSGPSAERLADAAWRALRWRNVDFALLDCYYHVILLVELDDRSHDSEDRKAKDRMLNAMVATAGFKIARIPIEIAQDPDAVSARLAETMAEPESAS